MYDTVKLVISSEVRDYRDVLNVLFRQFILSKYIWINKLNKTNSDFSM